MQYTGFEIENFKGVGRAKIALNARGDSNVVTIVGLNESGKTTLLEGIYSFSPDTESRNLFDKAGLLDYRDIARIPKSKLFNFNEKIIIKAGVKLEAGEKEKLTRKISQHLDLDFREDNLPETFTIEDTTFYSESEVQSRSVAWSIGLSVTRLSP